jgi:hypothetical protein
MSRVKFSYPAAGSIFALTAAAVSMFAGWRRPSHTQELG